jgi:phospholipase/carboxylesterase
MPLETLDIDPGVPPAATLIVLHGLGADGNDFVPICDELDLSRIGPIRFVFPNAPVRPVTINGGYPMRAWYDILAMGGRGPEDEAGLRQSVVDIEALLAREQARGVPASRTVLMGFSQGCAMSLLAGLRHGHRLAGIVALSGYLPLADTLAAERSTANADVPVFMAHGRHDDIVNIARGQQARETLTGLGYKVEWHDYAMPHSVCPEEVADLNGWLLRALAPEAA